jgi:hypothetical protein
LLRLSLYASHNHGADLYFIETRTYCFGEGIVEMSALTSSKHDDLVMVDEQDPSAPPVFGVSFDVEKNAPRVSAITTASPPDSPGQSRKRKTLGDLNSGVRINCADPDQVIGPSMLPPIDDNMSKTTPKAIRGGDIVKIFISDNDVIEVSPEHLERVKKMHARMEEGAIPSFNYNTLLLVASILAGLGLVSNSSTTVIASMLVSPIMGPVVGLAYGTTILDWKLVRRSMITELVSLVVCIIVGMAVGAITGPTSLASGWPTEVRKNERCDNEFIYGALPFLWIVWSSLQT